MSGLWTHAPTARRSISTMNILFHGINYWPDETGIAVFTTARAEYLASRGHHVTVSTGFPYYPSWKIPEAYRGRLFDRETRNGVTIDRSFMYVPRRVTSLRRVFHEASFIATSTLRMLAGRRPDLIFSVSPPLGLGMSAFFLSRLWKTPYVFHVADLQPDAAAELGMLREGRLLRTLYAVERVAYRKAALVATLTEAMRDRIVSKGVPASKIVLFSDWANPDLFKIPSEEGGRSFRARHGLGNNLLVTHSGNMGVKQGLEVILEAAALSANTPGITWLLVGDGAMRERLMQRANAQRINNLKFLPLLSTDEFRQMLSAADICLITQQKAVADIVFPSKVMTLMAASRPIVASLSLGSEVARVLRESGAGEIVTPENPEALRDAVLGLMNDSRRRLAMGPKGRDYARLHWDRERILPLLESRLVREAHEHAPAIGRAVMNGSAVELGRLARRERES